MRLTTKIFLGFWGVTLASIIGFIFFIKAHEQESNPYQIQEPNMLEAIESESYKSIHINTESGYYNGSITVKDVPTSKIQVSRSTSTDIEKKVVGDTLILNLKIKDLEESDRFNEMSYTDIVIPSQENLELAIDAAHLSIRIDSVNINNLDLKIRGGNQISIQNASIGHLTTQPYEEQTETNPITYKLSKSQIGEWIMKVNNINYWGSSFESSHIKALHISGYDEIKLPGWNYDKLNWEPLNEDAKLVLELEKQSSIEVK